MLLLFTSLSSSTYTLQMGPQNLLTPHVKDNGHRTHVHTPMDDAARVQEVQAPRHRHSHILALVVPAEFICAEPDVPQKGSVQVAALPCVSAVRATARP